MSLGLTQSQKLAHRVRVFPHLYTLSLSDVTLGFFQMQINSCFNYNNNNNNYVFRYANKVHISWGDFSNLCRRIGLTCLMNMNFRFFSNNLIRFSVSKPMFSFFSIVLLVLIFARVVVLRMYSTTRRNVIIFAKPRKAHNWIYLKL